jgi:CRP-like cAMP-binding protein
LPRDSFEELLDDDPDLAAAVRGAMAERLRSVER